MNTKVCFKCNTEKELSDFYKHPKMGDGHLNKCKECTKKDSMRQYNINRKNADWVEKEKQRGRDKARRLGYNEKYKPSAKDKSRIMLRYFLKYPEKKEAYIACQHMKATPGFERHHWSYNKQHYLDIIELTAEDHAMAHIYMTYDQSCKMYRTKNGILLDTKEKHLAYISLMIKKERARRSA